MLLSDSDFTAFLRRGGITGYEGWTTEEINAALQAGQDWVTEQTDREWESATEDRHFTGRGTQVLELFEFTAVSQVNENGTDLDSALYQALPLNMTVQYQLRLKTRAWHKPTDGSVGNIVVSGTWGATPNQDIKDAICYYALSLGQGGQLVQDPTDAPLSRVSAFGVSYDQRSSADGRDAAEAPVEKARRLLRPHVDLAARRSRILQGRL